MSSPLFPSAFYADSQSVLTSGNTYELEWYYSTDYGLDSLCGGGFTVNDTIAKTDGSQYATNSVFEYTAYPPVGLVINMGTSDLLNEVNGTMAYGKSCFLPFFSVVFFLSLFRYNRYDQESQSRTMPCISLHLSVYGCLHLPKYWPHSYDEKLGCMRVNMLVFALKSDGLRC